MEEIRNIMVKYDEKYVSEYLNSVTDLNKYAGSILPGCRRDFRLPNTYQKC